MSEQKLDCVAEVRDRLVEIGDLDLKRNLKIRAFLELVLAPVFRDLQPRLRYVEMGRRGITPMQYFQDFRNYPAAHGYGDRFEGRYEIRLCRSVSHERRGAGAEEQRVERLILETRATLTGRPATGAPAALGFDPPVGAPAVAGTGRVLHVLTRPQEPPGRRWVSEIPQEIAFLTLHPFEDPFPTIGHLAELESGFVAVEGGSARLTGVWGVANSDVFQHIHAREYTVAMENGIALSMAAANLPLESYLATRARVIFRRPSFVGQRYALGIRLFHRDTDIVALGAFHAGDDAPVAGDSRAAVYLRFEGRLA
ncbi:MAG TPA: hypothetical protein VGZ72_00490 [Stellaceae bacterium]|jgi:hypothetical protein|nr:hypothetical protein [Stellaceae bacterium]